MPQQQGGFGVHPSFGNFVQDPTAQLGFQMGKSAVDAGQQYVEQNVRRRALSWVYPGCVIGC
jgi:hypothetical protein